jgi:hypothetical protein
MKNRAQLPRTAGLRTLSELTAGLTKAGLDPSRIQERAQLLAKVAGTKRKRHEDEDAEMDVDGEQSGEGEGEGEEWMDVDGDDEDAAPNKRAKTNAGGAAVVNRRQPRSDRQLAGMRNDAVGPDCPALVIRLCLTDKSCRIFSKPRRLSSYETLANEDETCTPRLARATVRSVSRWSVDHHLFFSGPCR